MSTNRQAGSFLVVVSRVYWLLCGPMILLLTATKILSNGDGWQAPASVLFLVVLLLLPVARWVEFRGGDPMTSTGTPATPADLRRYALIALGVGLSVWLFANAISNHALPVSRIKS